MVGKRETKREQWLRLAGFCEDDPKCTDSAQQGDEKHYQANQIHDNDLVAA